MISDVGYGAILADPPWPESGGGKIKRGADRHYPLMKVEEIKALRVNGQPVIAHAKANAHLYLWATNNYLMAAGEVMKAWGFRYVTCVTWVKTGKPGLGQYFRGMTEHLLFGRCGTPPYKPMPNGKRAQGRTMVMAPRGEHSEKPAAFHELVELVSHGPYLELFARRPMPGWDVWGNEVSPELRVRPEADICPSLPAAPGASP